MSSSAASRTARTLPRAPRSARRVFVNQQHPDGRITLIDWESGEKRTVTGYEINSKIRD